MRKQILLVLTVAGVGFASGAALALTSPGAPGSDKVIPEKEEAAPLASGRSESLSHKLDSSGGVIKPKPGVDPGIMKTAPVPEPNSMPIIPPPETPGGAPGVEAK